MNERNPEAVATYLVESDIKTFANQAWESDDGARARLVAAGLLRTSERFNGRTARRDQSCTITKLGRSMGRWGGSEGDPSRTVWLPTSFGQRVAEAIARRAARYR